MKEKKKLSLAAQIFIALVLAIIAGLLMQNYADFANSYIKPFGTIFLNLVKFIVVPIVLFSIMCGIISMSDIRKVGSIGLKTVVYYLCTTAFAIAFGLCVGNLFKGMFPVVATTDLVYEASEPVSFMDTIVNIFPSNFFEPMVNANMMFSRRNFVLFRMTNLLQTVLYRTILQVLSIVRWLSHSAVSRMPVCRQWNLQLIMRMNFSTI